MATNAQNPLSGESPQPQPPTSGGLYDQESRTLLEALGKPDPDANSRILLASLDEKPNPRLEAAGLESVYQMSPDGKLLIHGTRVQPNLTPTGHQPA